MDSADGRASSLQCGRHGARSRDPAPGGAGVPAQTPVAARADLAGLRYLQAPLTFGSAGAYALSPSGTIVAQLISSWRTSVARERLWGEEVSDPHLWAQGSPLHSLVNAFEDRVFPHHRPLNFALRRRSRIFALISRAELTSRHLPLRLFETSQNFRRQQRGELQRVGTPGRVRSPRASHSLAGSRRRRRIRPRQLQVQVETHPVWSDSYVCFFRILESAGASEYDVIRQLALRVPVVFDVSPNPAGIGA